MPENSLFKASNMFLLTNTNTLKSYQISILNAHLLKLYFSFSRIKNTKLKKTLSISINFIHPLFSFISKCLDLRTYIPLDPKNLDKICLYVNKI